MRRWIGQGLALALLLAGLIGGLYALSRWASDQVRDRERYAYAFADIDCSPPPGQERAEFLDEVQYHAAMPGRFSVLEDGLAKKLAEAFARHPWVEKVESVKVAARVQVALSYRRPALAVPVGDSLRAVDGAGILLPKSAPVAGLPVFSQEARPPAGPAGTRWGDPAVEAAAKAMRKS